jgi:hypothetical protein
VDGERASLEGFFRDEVLEHQRHPDSLVLGSLDRLLTSQTDLIANRERVIALILGR